MDWLNFFETNRINYRTSGPNVSKGAIVCHCPWCGAADESEHLVVSLENKGFKCWRDRQHAGKNPARLIQALLSCSWEQANSLVDQTKTLPNDFMSKVRSSIQKSPVIQRAIYPKIPIEFKPFTSKPSCRIFVDYLKRRGFSEYDIFEGTIDYDIYYAWRGDYKGRIVFTVWHDSKLVGWTGRTVYESEQARYKTLTNDVEKAKDRREVPAPNPISNYLLFWDQLQEIDADTLLLCEGPFDAWKLNVLGKSMGIAATCFFTSTISKQQLNLLHEILPKFKRRYLVLDQNTFSKAARIKSDLTALDVPALKLPKDVDDPGDLRTVEQLKLMLAIV